MNDPERKITATIQRSMRWGPFAYWVTITDGPMRIGEHGGFHAWTRAGAERKARRIAASIRRDRRARDQAQELDLS